MAYSIRIAHARSKHGFTVFSYEAYQSATYGAQKSGWHIASADTLPEARRAIDEAVSRDWRAVGRDVPPIIECGKVSRFAGERHIF